MKKKIYLICNSHLDPIWLWNRTSGRSAWLNTMHSVVRIMQENPDMKFTCSAAAQYRYIEECDPALFRKISELIREKRWEIVGGWEVQPDVIISRPQPLIHQALSGKKYFLDRFNVDVKIGYCVDSLVMPPVCQKYSTLPDSPIMSTHAVRKLPTFSIGKPMMVRQLPLCTSSTHTEPVRGWIS